MEELVNRRPGRITALKTIPKTTTDAQSIPMTTCDGTVPAALSIVDCVEEVVESTDGMEVDAIEERLGGDGGGEDSDIQLNGPMELCGGCDSVGYTHG